MEVTRLSRAIKVRNRMRKRVLVALACVSAVATIAMAAFDLLLPSVIALSVAVLLLVVAR